MATRIRPTARLRSSLLRSSRGCISAASLVVRTILLIVVIIAIILIVIVIAFLLIVVIITNSNNSNSRGCISAASLVVGNFLLRNEISTRGWTNKLMGSKSGVRPEPTPILEGASIPPTRREAPEFLDNGILTAQTLPTRMKQPYWVLMLSLVFISSALTRTTAIQGTHFSPGHPTLTKQSHLSSPPILEEPPSSALSGRRVYTVYI